MGYNPQLAGGVNKKRSRQMPQHTARQESISSLQYIEHFWDPTFGLLASLKPVISGTDEEAEVEGNICWASCVAQPLVFYIYLPI